MVDSQWSWYCENFIHDDLDKWDLELRENHHFMYGSIFHNCETIKKVLDHVLHRCVVIPHLTMGQFFHVPDLLLSAVVGENSELLQFWSQLFTEKHVFSSEKKKIVKKIGINTLLATNTPQRAVNSTKISRSPFITKVKADQISHREHFFWEYPVLTPTKGYPSDCTWCDSSLVIAGCSSGSNL